MLLICPHKAFNEPKIDKERVRKTERKARPTYKIPTRKMLCSVACSFVRPFVLTHLFILFVTPYGVSCLKILSTGKTCVRN